MNILAYPILKCQSVVLFGLTVLLISCGSQSNSTQPSESSYSIDEAIEVDTPFVKLMEIPSLDSLKMTADWKHISYDNDLIILCHQAGWSRGEYVATSDSLYKLGFNCLAIDQRSGKQINEVDNETAKRAEEAGKDQNYENAEQDIVAALRWAKSKYNGDIILMGSSYSAGLVLKIGAEEPEGISKIVSFSPGEYYGDFKLADEIKELTIPCFLTSSQKEANGVQKLFKVIQSSKKIQFIPAKEGAHGSRVLWQQNSNHQEYWKALRTFLGR